MFAFSRLAALTSYRIMADRVLVCEAIVYRCKLFCTRDWTTILKHRTDLKELPLDIVTPAEWWMKIQPYARLWV